MTRGVPVLVLALLALALPAWAQPSQRQVLSERSAMVGELIGLDPLAVRARLGEVPADTPVVPALDLVTPHGRLTFITANGLMMSPIMRENLARLSAHGSLMSVPAYVSCNTNLAENPSAAGGVLTLMFRDGRLEAVYRRGPPTALDPDAPMDAFYASQLPKVSPFVPHAGALPLVDGDGFLARWRRVALPPETRIAAKCDVQPPFDPQQVHVAPAPRQPFNPQGLVGLPFVPVMPFLNASRTESRREGVRTLAELEVGRPINAEAFAAGHPHVGVLHGPDPGYVMLGVNLGSYASNNLDDTDGLAFAGIRDGRVVWVAPLVGGVDGSGVTIGLTSHAPCLGQQGWFRKAGCNPHGAYTP